MGSPSNIVPSVSQWERERERGREIEVKLIQLLKFGSIHLVSSLGYIDGLQRPWKRTYKYNIIASWSTRVFVALSRLRTLDSKPHKVMPLRARDAVVGAVVRTEEYFRCTTTYTLISPCIRYLMIYRLKLVWRFDETKDCVNALYFHRNVLYFYVCVGGE